MKCVSIAAGLVGATALWAWTPGHAAEPVDLGKTEYKNNCAVCHGLSGKGDGPFKGIVDVPAGADLTTLAKRNNGVFPFVRVYETIDGTQMIKAHGTREMPIWGADYRLRATGQRDDVGNYLYDTDAFVRGRILALTEYVYRLQAK
ncbi:MAG: c-type cytochrome [Burkholderiales bacterium]